MRRLFTILTLFIVLILSIAGCKKKDVTEYNYLYEGENELWSAQYQVNATSTYITYKERVSYENEEEDQLLVTYLGDLDDLAKVRHFEISYELDFKSGSLTQDYSDDDQISSKTFTLNSKDQNGVIPKKDDTVKVTITLDDEVQTFELKANE